MAVLSIPNTDDEDAKKIAIAKQDLESTKYGRLQKDGMPNSPYHEPMSSHVRVCYPNATWFAAQKAIQPFRIPMHSDSSSSVPIYW